MLALEDVIRRAVRQPRVRHLRRPRRRRLNAAAGAAFAPTARPDLCTRRTRARDTTAGMQRRSCPPDGARRRGSECSRGDRVGHRARRDRHRSGCVRRPQGGARLQFDRHGGRPGLRAPTGADAASAARPARRAPAARPARSRRRTGATRQRPARPAARPARAAPPAPADATRRHRRPTRRRPATRPGRDRQRADRPGTTTGPTTASARAARDHRRRPRRPGDDRRDDRTRSRRWGSTAPRDRRDRRRSSPPPRRSRRPSVTGSSRAAADGRRADSRDRPRSARTSITLGTHRTGAPAAPTAPPPSLFAGDEPARRRPARLLGRTRSSSRAARRCRSSSSRASTSRRSCSRSTSRRARPTASRGRSLAAINEVETDYGTNLDTSSAGAIGWMQFLPSTWRATASTPAPPGVARSLQRRRRDLRRRALPRRGGRRAQPARRDLRLQPLVGLRAVGAARAPSCFERRADAR